MYAFSHFKEFFFKFMSEYLYMKFVLETADEVITQQTLEASEVKFLLYTAF